MKTNLYCKWTFVILLLSFFYFPLLPGFINVKYVSQTGSLNSQTVLQDAIALRKFIKTSEEGAPTNGYFVEMEDHQLEYYDLLRRILNIPDTVSGANLGQIIADSLFENPFISADEEDAPKILMPQSYASITIADDRVVNQAPVYSPSSDYSTNTGGASGGGFTTRLVDGFSRWLVKRTKQEMSLHFFSKFKNALNKQQDLNVLFPTTVNLLNVLDEEVYNYKAYLASMKEAFMSDYSLMPDNLGQWADQSQIIKNDNLRFILKQGFGVTPLIMEGTTPLDIMHHLSNVDETPKEYRSIFGSLKLLDVLCNTLHNRQTGWAVPNTWKKDVDDLTLYLFLGVLYQKTKDISIGSINFGGFLNDIAQSAEKDKVETFKSLVTSLLEQGRKTNKIIEVIERDSVSYPQFHQYSQSTVKFFRLIQEFTAPFIGDENATTFVKLLDVVDHSNNLVFHIRQRNYLQGLADFNIIVDNFIPDQVDTESPTMSFKKEFIKYSTFMATVADAQSSEAIEYAFEIFALPPGSSRMKKYSDVSVALNAYVGPTVGTEFLEDNGSNTIFALHAPVGINLNFGRYEKGSHSLFIPIVDVGAVTAFRFGDDTSTLPELSFKNLIAPGFYYVYGFGKDRPFALGLGGQLGPNTRKIEFDESGNTLENTIDSGVRLGVFFSVDIPVFHFYTK